MANMCLVPVILLRSGENTIFMGCTGSEIQDLDTASAAIALQNKSCMLILREYFTGTKHTLLRTSVQKNGMWKAS
jgi:hypothetical protein